MKRILNKLCVVAFALAMLASATGCVKSRELNNEHEGYVYVTLTADKGEMSKTTLEADGASMTVKWTAQDTLFAVGSVDGLLGKLRLTGGEGTSTGKFGGTLSYLTAKQDINFYYVGEKQTITGDSYSLSLASQAGTLEDIQDNMHVMYGTLTDVEPSTVNFGAVAFSNLISIVKVDTKTVFGDETNLIIKGACASASIDLKTCTATPAFGDITITGAASEECFLAVIQKNTTDALRLDFVNSTGTKGSSLPAKIIVEGRFYTSSGNSISMLGGYCEDGFYYGEGIEIDGVTWAPVNCGIGFNCAYRYGKLYQFGRYDGQGYIGEPNEPTGDNLVNSTTANPEPEKFYYDEYDWKSGTKLTMWPLTSADAGYLENKIANPCPTGWRVPTYDELNSLLSVESTWKEGTDIYGIGSGTINGRSFGTGDQKIFMPACGYRGCSDGVASDRDGDGNYWSSKVYTDGFSSYHMFFNSSKKEMQYDGRAGGYAVRCVKQTTTTASTDAFNNKIGW